MDDDSRLSSRTSSMNSLHSEINQDSDQNKQFTELSINDIDVRFINQICQRLSLDETESESRIIVKKLLINGRQELIHHSDSIAPLDFEEQMNNRNDSELLNILKNYFEQQWHQFPYDWFQTFLTEQKSKDNYEHYQQVLARTAEYGQKFMNECSVFSIVLQLVLAFDGNINEYETIFNNVWNTFIMDGCEIALKKWKKYIIHSCNNPLYLALREYFREPILSLFEQSKIIDQRNLLEITLDCLAKVGWNAGLNQIEIKQLISSKRHTTLIDNLKELLRIELPIPSPRTKPEKHSAKPLEIRRSSNTTDRQDDNSQLPIMSQLNDDDIVVYISDLPPQITDDLKLQNMIRQCLKRKHKQEIIDIYCNTRLGIGRVYLHNNRDKDYFINVLQSIVLSSEDDENHIIIKFSLNIELISYVVIELSNEQNLPFSNDVARQWARFYNVRRPCSCKQLSVQFPNIFRIISDSLNEMIQIMETREFTINNQHATVYFCANCSFLEELSRNTSTDQIRHTISNQLDRTRISERSLYIQHNQKAMNAVILTCNKARKWMLFDSINLDGRIISKKNILSCRLLLRPIPKGFSTSLIQKHEIFQNSIANISLRDDCLILELSNTIAYDECIQRGALRVGDHLLLMEVPTYANPDPVDFNAKTWFKKEMFKHKSDIMPFIANPQHPIFRWNWDPQIFQEEFRCNTTIDCGSRERMHEYYRTDINQKHALLRMTVMLNTIGTVWKGNYRLAGNEVKLKEDKLKTIVYDHQSKLQNGRRVLLSDANRTPYTSTLIKVINDDCLHVYQGLVTQKCCPVLISMINGDSPDGDYRKGNGDQQVSLFYRSNYFRSLDIDIDNDKPINRFYCNANCELEILSDGRQMYPLDEFGAIYTSGVTLFRQAEETGYAFMDEPLRNICSIVISVYKDLKVDKNRLDTKFSIKMRKKIENIFAIAYHHKHDCLILPSLIDNGVKYPSECMISIFKSVAEQYAGFFKSVYFFINHNHNQELQPDQQRTIRLFKQSLDNIELRQKQHKMEGMMIGSWRILDMVNSQQVNLSGVRISYLTPCRYGGKCNDLQDVRHCREYSHPPLCPLTSNGTTCKLLNDDDHMLWFIHRSKYSHAADCSITQEDKKHSNQFEHLPYCREGGYCKNTNVEHLRAFRHVPMCKYGLTCIEFKKKIDNHCWEYRHCDEFRQPSSKLTPCLYSINCLHREDPDHIKKYSHPCQYAELCREKNKEPYLTHEPHMVDHCQMGQSCKNLDNPVHRAKYRHTGMPDFLIPCRYQQQCYETSYEHRTKFSHGEHIDILPRKVPPISPADQDRTSDYEQNSRKISCRYGSECRDIYVAHHCSKYSHPKDRFHAAK